MRTSRIAIGLAVTAVLLMASALTAAAQIDELKNTTPEQRAKAQTAYMKGKLDLTPAQLTQVEAMNRKYADQFQKFLASKEEMRDKVMEGLKNR
jgi:Spy/CpxP family protein refolding chaperone